MLKTEADWGFYFHNGRDSWNRYLELVYQPDGTSNTHQWLKYMPGVMAFPGIAIKFY